MYRSCLRLHTELQASLLAAALLVPDNSQESVIQRFSRQRPCSTCEQPHLRHEHHISHVQDGVECLASLPLQQRPAARPCGSGGMVSAAAYVCDRARGVCKAHLQCRSMTGALALT